MTFDIVIFMDYYRDMNMINIAEFKAHVSKYIAKAETGENIIISRRNIPVARLLPQENTVLLNRTKIGRFSDTLKIHGDIVKHAIDPSEWEVL